ncbi:MAG: 54S ribosomal protein L22, mitochondrial [Trizodia sp. TS-e1964]|nr:MAG: 54S ribosomal protein L22, mitochondrial [Trizodia sp. TS-e1964]
MSLSTSRRLVRPALALKSPPSSPPSLPRTTLFQPTTHPSVPISHRTLFNFFRGSKKDAVKDTKAGLAENPIMDDFLKKGGVKARAAAPLKRGGLASSSIFADDKLASEELPARADSRTSVPISERNPDYMAAVLDPHPSARQRWERKMVIRSVRRRGRLSHVQQIKQTERAHLSKSPMIKTSVKKLGPLARQIAGKNIEDAIVQMRFSKKKAAIQVRRQLIHARDEAMVARGMGLGKAVGAPPAGPAVTILMKDGRRRVVKDRTAMYIDQAWVGRGMYRKTLEFRARGKVNTLRHPHTSITILLKEEATLVRQAGEREAKRKARKPWVQLPNRPIQGQRQYYCW